MAINAEQLNIILSARDKEFAKAMERNQRRVEQFARRSQKDLSQTGRSFADLGKSAKLASAIMSGVVVASLIKVTRNALAAAESISDTANATNATIEGLQKLRFAADQNGLSAKQMDDALLRLTRRMSMFVQDGGGPAAKAIEQLGLSVKDADGNMRSSDAVFADIADRLATMEDRAQAAALASQLFGDRVGPQLVPLLMQGRDGIKQFGDEAERMGLVLDEAGVKKAGAANAKLRALGDSLRGQVNQAVLDNVDAIEELADAFERLIPEIGKAFSSLVSFVSKLAEMRDIARVLYVLAGPGTLSDLVPEGGSGGPQGAPRVRPVARPAPIGPSLPRSAPISFGQTRATSFGFIGPIPSFGSARGNVPQGFGEFVTPPTPSGGTGGTGSQGGGGGGRDIDQIRQAYDRLIASLDDAVALSQEYDRQQDVLNDAFAAGAITSEEYAAGMDATAQAYRDAQFEASELGQIMQTVESSMEDAFMSMIDGTASAKDAFRAMAQDIIRELYRVLVVQQLVGQFQTGGGGILGALAPMFGRASGGPVTAGQPYMVGEHGREPFVPAENGRILSVAQAQEALSGGRGQSITINYSFQGGVTEADLRRALPALVDGTKRAVIDQVQRGGAMARVFK